MQVKRAFLDAMEQGKGYTEANFAAFAMLGKRFCPRIRGLSKQRIYYADPERDYGALRRMLERGIEDSAWTGWRSNGTGSASSSARWRPVTRPRRSR